MGTSMEKNIADLRKAVGLSSLPVQKKGDSRLMQPFGSHETSCMLTTGERLWDYFAVSLKMQKVIVENKKEIIQVICPMAKSTSICFKNCSVKELSKELGRILGIDVEIEFLERTLPSEISGKEIVPFNLAFEKKRVKDKMKNRKVLGSLEIL